MTTCMAQDEATGKACELDATRRVVIVMHAPAPHPPTPVKLSLGLVCCDDHGRDIRIDELMDDRGYARIAQAFLKLGRVPPERSSARAVTEPLDEDEPVWPPSDWPA